MASLGLWLAPALHRRHPSCCCQLPANNKPATSYQRRQNPTRWRRHVWIGYGSIRRSPVRPSPPIIPLGPRQLVPLGPSLPLSYWEWGEIDWPRMDSKRLTEGGRLDASSLLACFFLLSGCSCWILSGIDHYLDFIFIIYIIHTYNSYIVKARATSIKGTTMSKSTLVVSSRVAISLLLFVMCINHLSSASETSTEDCSSYSSLPDEEFWYDLLILVFICVFFRLIALSLC